MADAFLACETVDADFFVFVQVAFVVLVDEIGRGGVGRVGVDVRVEVALGFGAFRVERAELECVEALGDLFGPAAVDELVDVEWGAAVRTLGALFGEPAVDAGVAAEFGAVGAEARVSELFHAYEAFEYFGYCL